MMTDFLRHIEACNPLIKEKFIPLKIDGGIVGWLRPVIVDYLRQWVDEFDIQSEQVSVTEKNADFETRSALFSKVVAAMARDNLVNLPINEAYPITVDTRENALCVVDRVAAAVFGLRSFGQHLNGYVIKDDGLYLWIATRARDRLIFPGYLDNMVAGGLPYGISMKENLVKEGLEEADVPEKLMDKAKFVSTLTYNRVSESGFRPDTLYCYDLALPQTFVPKNTDGEVENFQLLPMSSVYDLVFDTDRFKLNCNLVIIDFLIRHQFIKPEHQTYQKMVDGLRQPLGIY